MIERARSDSSACDHISQYVFTKRLCRRLLSRGVYTIRSNEYSACSSGAISLEVTGKHVAGKAKKGEGGSFLQWERVSAATIIYELCAIGGRAQDATSVPI